MENPKTDFCFAALQKVRMEGSMKAVYTPQHEYF